MAGVCAFAMAVATVLATPPAPAAAASSEVVGAKTPTALAISVSRRRFPASGSARLAILARDDVFADALAASGLQSDGPLLITDGRRLDSGVASELRRVVTRGGTVHLLGGPRALSTGVEAAVERLGLRVTRHSGADRVDTAALLARAIGRSRTALVARADSWPDAIAAGAAAAEQGLPLVLTDRRRLDRRAAKALSDLGVTETIVLGGTAALSNSVLKAVPGGRRVAGDDRYATAAAIARDRFRSARTAVFAPGDGRDGWAWGLAVAGLAADAGAPLLYSAGTTVPPSSADTGGGCASAVRRRIVVGRPSQVSKVAAAAATCRPPTERMAHEIFLAANAERRARGLRPLRWDSELARMATQWSGTMSRRGSLSHRPSMMSYGRLRSRFRSVGENVYSGAGGARWYGSAGAAHAGWMKSSGHRRNLLQPAYTHIGVGVVCVGDRVYATQNLAGDGSAGRVRSGTPASRPVVHDGAPGTACS